MTVVALPLEEREASTLRESDLDEHVALGSGNGGQHRQKTLSAIRLRHKPTGLEVRIGSGRSQHQNRAWAREILAARVGQLQRERQAAADSVRRRQLAGSGERGDKIRTYRVQDGIVADLRTGLKLRLSRVLAGELP